jgi:hypothetical protein
VNGNLPTTYLDGTYLSFSGAASALYPVVRGDNTLFVNGRSDCLDALWGDLAVHALFVHNSLPATLTAP